MISEDKLPVPALTRVSSTFLKKLWCYYAHGSGIAVVALGVSFVMVFALAHDGPVVRRIGEIDNPTKITTVMGTVDYVIDVERLEGCPGEWTALFKSHTVPPATVTISRPAMPSSLLPGVRSGRHVSIQLPQAVFPGSWTVIAGITSTCPTRRKYDELARFDFDVVAP